MSKRMTMLFLGSLLLGMTIMSCQKKSEECREKCNSQYDESVLEVEEGVGICITGIEGYVYNAATGQCEHSWAGPFKTMEECNNCGCDIYVD